MSKAKGMPRYWVWFELLRVDGFYEMKSLHWSTKADGTATYDNFQAFVERFNEELKTNPGNYPKRLENAEVVTAQFVDIEATGNTTLYHYSA